MMDLFMCPGCARVMCPQSSCLGMPQLLLRKVTAQPADVAPQIVYFGGRTSCIHHLTDDYDNEASVWCMLGVVVRRREAE
jgi:hypothetical protein